MLARNGDTNARISLEVREREREEDFVARVHGVYRDASFGYREDIRINSVRGVRVREEHRVGGEADRKFQPQMVSVQADDVSKLKDFEANGYNGPMRSWWTGTTGCAVAAHKDCEAVVTGIVGCAGLPPAVAAINAKKNICLANKNFNRWWSGDCAG